MRKDQYILKSIFKPTLNVSPSARGSNKIDLQDTKYLNAQEEPVSKGLISFFNPQHISAILCHYSALKLETKSKFQSDFYYLLQDFDNLLNKTLETYPLYFDLVKLKIQNKTNLEIQSFIQKKYKIKHSIEYISALWRNKIPKLIAEQAKKDYVFWYYSTQKEKKNAWKICSRCECKKPLHNYFFSKNSSSKDGFYSICKECRNKKK